MYRVCQWQGMKSGSFQCPKLRNEVRPRIIHLYKFLHMFVWANMKYVKGCWCDWCVCQVCFLATLSHCCLVQSDATLISCVCTFPGWGMRTLDSGRCWAVEYLQSSLLHQGKAFDMAAGKTIGMLSFGLSSRKVASCNWIFWNAIAWQIFQGPAILQRIDCISQDSRISRSSSQAYFGRTSYCVKDVPTYCFNKFKLRQNSLKVHEEFLRLLKQQGWTCKHFSLDTFKFCRFIFFAPLNLVLCFDSLLGLREERPSESGLRSHVSDAPCFFYVFSLEFADVLEVDTWGLFAVPLSWTAPLVLYQVKSQMKLVFARTCWHAGGHTSDSRTSGFMRAVQPLKRVQEAEGCLFSGLYE